MRRVAVTTACLAALLLLSLAAPAAAEDPPAAADITRGCQFTRDGKNKVTLRVSDRDLCTVCELEQGERLSVASKSGAALGWLYLRFDGVPPACTLAQYDRDGACIREEVIAPDLPYAVVPLADGCARAELRSDAAPASLCEATVYGVGALPADAPVWEPPVERTDFLIVTTHPDDEWLYLGAVYPIYGGERGLVGTFAYVTMPSYGRLHEALNGLWRGGVRSYPFFLGFPDVDRSAPEEDKEKFRQEDITLALVRLYRRLRPLVVVTQDPIEGEYGHWQHIVAANAAIDAAALSADPAYDPASAAEYGTWEPKKTYAHRYPEHTLYLDALAELAAYGGRTALAVARDAYQAHASQRELAFYPETSDRLGGDIRWFGLVRTTVGYDTEADMFEHIGAELYVKNLPPAKSQLPTEAPTPAETQLPSEAPLSTEAPTPAETPTESPADSPAPDGGGTASISPVLLAACALVAVGGIVFAADRLRRRRKR